MISVRNVLTMNKRMAIWTNNHKIFSFVVIPISVFMVNAENFFYIVISASLAFLDNSSSKPKFSKIIRSFWFKNLRHPTDIGARMGTVFSLSARRMNDWFVAKKAIRMNLPTSYRTPFGSTFSIVFYFKYFIATFTNKRMHLCR